MREFICFLMLLIFLTNAEKSGLFSKKIYKENYHISVLNLDANDSLRCPPNTIQSQFDNKVCFLFVNESRSFDDAEIFCNGKSGDLAVVSSQFVNGFLYSKALEKFGAFNNYWIGGKMKTVKINAASAINVWGWTQLDRLMTFSDWDPTSTSTGNCTAVQFNSLWSAIDCDSKNPFVCQVPTEFSYCEEGWDYFNRTNSCYRKFVVTTYINQPTAENLCIQKGGHLSSIHTVEENQFIGEITSIGYKAAGWASVFWIGAQRNDNSDNWYWIDNSTFDYSNWGYSCDYSNHFCSEFWPDWTTDSINNKPLQWNARRCSEVRIQKGGHLSSIHTVEENRFIGQITSIGGYKTNGWASVFWIGAKRNDNSDNWYWIDNSTFDYSNWGDNYDYTNYFCSNFYPDWTIELKKQLSQWNAWGCSDVSYGYLCKKSPNVFLLD